ncbi:MAG: amino acid adenylation domain protein, partial [Chthonomonadales bacterium]|nr:amino acid adenylation domain protein [Chthonomonadales bacterium]
PKGAAVFHRGFSNLVQWFVTDFAFSPTDRTLLITSISFDLTQKNLYAVLSVGGQLHLAPSGIYDPEVIASAIAACGATHLNCTPSHFYPLAADPGEVGYSRLASLRYVYLGGEPIDLSQLKPWLEHRLCQAQLINTYGPTECADIAAFYILPRHFSAEQQTLPIGGPIPNVNLYVLDEHQEPVPEGVAGELYIGGEGVGYGYIGHPEWTAERFLPDLFSNRPGARMYRTGDLVRALKSGNLEFLERLDHQVKIRGFRIELGEVESALVQYSGVRQAVVMGREDVPGEKRLVAYIVGDEGAVSSRQLREHLLGKLPGYMVPAMFVFLETFPLSPNGKIDRKALPIPEGGMHRDRPLVTARDPLETQLVQIWEAVLGFAPIGIEDNFFEIGGHSLLAGRLFAAIAETRGKDLPLSSLLEAPTIRQQAELLRRTQSSKVWKSLVRIKPEGLRPPIFGVHGGQGTALFYRQLAYYLHPDQPLYGLQQQGLDGRRTVLTRIEDMAAHYIKEIQEIRPHGPYHLIGYCFGGVVAFEMARQLVQAGEQVELLGLMNSPSPDYDLFADYNPSQSPNIMDETASVSHSHQIQGARSSSRLWSRVGRRYNFYRQQAIIRLRRYVSVVTLFLGGTIPLEYRKAYTSSINDRALLRYTAGSYSGKMLVIRGAGLFHDPTIGWDGKALQGLDLHEIAGQHGNYGDLIVDPHVQRLAAILDTAMVSSLFTSTTNR